VFENVKWKIPAFTPEEGELKFTITIANSEYDHNMHVNNTRYPDYCLNCFSVAELAVKKLKGFSISYVKQSKEGDTLKFYRKKGENGEYFVHGFNEIGEVVVQSKITFEE
jgi:acyl-ACP thioesterase